MRLSFHRLILKHLFLDISQARTALHNWSWIPSPCSQQGQGRTRAFYTSWYKEYPRLEYSQCQHTTHCFVCRHFCSICKYANCSWTRSWGTTGHICAKQRWSIFLGSCGLKCWTSYSSATLAPRRFPKSSQKLALLFSEFRCCFHIHNWTAKLWSGLFLYDCFLSRLIHCKS